MSFSHDVAVIGLGYVGLTLATAMAESGLRVLGVEKRAEIVKLTAAGTPHFREQGLDTILANVVAEGCFEARTQFESSDSCGIYIITVGTPLSSDGQARLDMIENAAREVAASMPDGALVILRSTVKIGTARKVVTPILEASGKRFDIAMCPERTLEGNAMAELRQLPQVVGADTPEARARAAQLFSRLTAQVLHVSSLETAEIIKLADNTYRDVRFAFANEIARLCDAVGVSAHEVISTGKLGYPRTNIAHPGLVGGPCLEKDPHILRESAQSYGIDLEITSAARLVNERQPDECAEFIVAELERRDAPANAIVTILGLAFKGVPETDDLRGAMPLKVIAALHRLRPTLRLIAFDPVVDSAELKRLGVPVTFASDVSEALNGAAAAIIANNHPLFASLGLSGIGKTMASDAFVYDFWNHFSDAEPARTGLPYFAVGNVKGRGR